MIMERSTKRGKVACPECGKEFFPRGITIDKPKLILAEDLYIHGFMFQTCQILKKTNDIQVLCFKSKSNLGPYLRFLAKMENFSQVNTILVARDTDVEMQSAANSVISAFKSVTNTNLPLPEEPFTYVSNDRMRTAFVLFPGPDVDGKYQIGSIEDLFLALVGRDELLKKCVYPFIECAQLNQENGETLTHPSKSKFHAYLSGKHHHSDVHPGVIAKLNLWKWDDQRIAPFRKIVEQI